VKWTTLLVSMVMVMVLTPSASSGTYPSSHPWIKLWAQRDRSLVASTRVAATIFGVSESWLRSCNRAEGGNIARWKLAITIRHPWAYNGAGWNIIGSYAFGPWQYMLDRKPPRSPADWGTFRSYVHPAFVAAKRRTVSVPYRFARPDSFVGQAITTAYMFSIGKSGHWSGEGC
jgi:hypothetical protein